MIKKAIIIALVLLLSSFCAAQWKGLRGNVFLDTGYDSNMGILSESQKEAFEAGDPYYMNMEAYDDIFAKAGGEIGYRFLIKRVRSEASVFYQYAGYVYNPDCSYHYIKPTLSFQRRSWQSSIYGKFVFGFATSIYNDVDLTNSPPVWAVYDAYRGGVEIRRDIIDKHSAGIDFEYGYSLYNDNFPEYDGASYRVGLAWRWSGPVYTKIAYAYQMYAARAFDIDGQTAESSRKTDISYNEDRIESYFSRGVEIAGERFLLGATIDISQRFYTSEKGFHLDYLHVARRDRRADFSPFVRWDLSSKIRITANYTHTIRITDTPYYDISPLKDYNRSIFSVKADYSFR